MRDKLGDDGAKILVEYVQQEIQRGASTREDLHLVRDELREDNQKLRNELYAVRDELHEDNQKLRNELYAVRDELTNFEWRMRLYFVLLALLMVLLNPNVTEFFARLAGFLTKRP